MTVHCSIMNDIKSESKNPKSERPGAWLFWGNTACYYAKLKDNMIELDGPVRTISLPKFTEAPWILCHEPQPGRPLGVQGFSE